jgi:hypothetical protein
MIRVNVTPIGFFRISENILAPLAELVIFALGFACPSVDAFFEG